MSNATSRVIASARPLASMPALTERRMSIYDTYNIIDPDWETLHVAYTGDTFLDRDPLTGVISYAHLDPYSEEKDHGHGW